jgi:hypothetical protein
MLPLFVFRTRPAPVASNPHRKLPSALALVATLFTLYSATNTAVALIILAAIWTLFFFPITIEECLAFVIAGIFFLGQNYVCLKAGLFEFRTKDVLLMPYYEPFLWGFYYLAMKRFVSGRTRQGVTVTWKTLVGLAATCVAFSLFASNPPALLVATACSTALLFAFFHTHLDRYYALCALTLGIVVELFGVSTGLWSYPASDLLGVPYWFATMWLSVGLLGRRLLIPASEMLAAGLRGTHRA